MIYDFDMSQGTCSECRSEKEHITMTEDGDIICEDCLIDKFAEQSFYGEDDET